MAVCQIPGAKNVAASDDNSATCALKCDQSAVRDRYCCRWMVEELHKAKKTGCGIEGLQFHTAEALEPMIALLSVTAVMLLNLREAARRPDAKERAARAPLPEEAGQGPAERARVDEGVGDAGRAHGPQRGRLPRLADGLAWLAEAAKHGRRRRNRTPTSQAIRVE